MAAVVGTQPVFIRDKETCDHFFIFGEKKETESCTGTHYTHCKFCGKNSHEHACDLITDLHNRGIVTHDTNEREKEKLYHIHVWEPVEGKPNTYKCLSDVTDWEKSKGNFSWRVPCDELITVNQ